MEEIQIGQYSIPIILMVILGIIYNVSGETLSNRIKPIISVVIGMMLGMVALLRGGLPFDIQHVIDYVLYGFMSGAAAVGIYETKRAIWRPRK